MLADSLKDGVLSTGLSLFGIQQASGSDAAAVQGVLQRLKESGFTPQQISVLVRAIADARGSLPDPGSLFDLVLSGPDLPGIPTRDTAAVMHTLLTQARREVLLVGYAIHKGADFFQPLAQRLEQTPDLRIRFCLDIRRPIGDLSSDAEIVGRFASEFRIKHWPWSRVPAVYYDPRSLVGNASERASLHAKCVVVDRSVAFVTSANFTEAAKHRNIEAGLLVRHEGMVERIAGYFDGLIAGSHLIQCPLA